MSGSRSSYKAVGVDIQYVNEQSLPHPVDQKNEFIKKHASAVGINIAPPHQTEATPPPSPTSLEQGGVTATENDQGCCSSYTPKQIATIIFGYTGAVISSTLLAVNGFLTPLGITSFENIEKTLPEAWGKASPETKAIACAMGGATVVVQGGFNAGVATESYRIIKESYRDCKTNTERLVNTVKQSLVGGLAALGAMPTATLAEDSFNKAPFGNLLAPPIAAITGFIFTSSRFNGIQKLMKRIQRALNKAQRLEGNISNKLDRILPDYKNEINTFLRERNDKNPDESPEDTLYALCDYLETMAENHNIFTDESKLYLFAKVSISLLFAIAAVSAVSPTFLAKSEAGWNLLSGNKLAGADIWSRRGLAAVPTSISDIFIGISNYDLWSALEDAKINIDATPGVGKKIAKWIGLLTLLGINFAGSFGFKNITQNVVETAKSVVSDLPGMDGGHGILAGILPWASLVAVSIVNGKTALQLAFPRPEEPLPKEVVNEQVKLVSDGKGNAVFNITDPLKKAQLLATYGCFSKPTETAQQLKEGKVEDTKATQEQIESEKSAREEKLSKLGKMRFLNTKNPHALTEKQKEKRPLINRGVSLPV